MTNSKTSELYITKTDLAAEYRRVRAETERICALLEPDDYQLQSIVETSPPKWHIAHVSWFFEAFVLPAFAPGYRPFHPGFAHLFNSYYETVGSMHPRSQRGLLSRPTVAEVYRYRAYVDEQMLALIERVEQRHWRDLAFRVTLGLHHEQQHQELLFMDIKHNFSLNPLRPVYSDRLQASRQAPAALGWIERPGGLLEIGHAGEGFAFDNETPRHQVLVREHRLASRPVSNGEFLAFMEDEGYARPELWLSDGWSLIKREAWRHPLYWHLDAGEWRQFTLGGMRKLNLDEPVCHLSFYEADAYARWAGKRLPSEAELELMLEQQPVSGNFADFSTLHPQPGDGQWYGDVWEWTATPYAPYPGFQPLAGSMGEYNGKFMCNQMVLRGGSCLTPTGHMRPSYRNFFYPHDRWPMTGLRLAEDA